LRSSRSVILTTLVLLACLWTQGRGGAMPQVGPRSVTGTIVVAGEGRSTDKSGVAIWLMPVDAPTRTRPAASGRPAFQMIQRGKRFQPRVLVVPTGSTVSFPNFDPIFHNVFSLFDGKRFDLGLYEAGSSRNVRFGQAGISHVFCNIHPEMVAAVVAVDTDYYTSSDAAGNFTIADVPAGRYQLHVWHDRFKARVDTEYPRTVSIGDGSYVLGALRLIDAGQALPSHKNKFGHDYIPPDAAAPTYAAP
jgi:plastocyanin